MQRDFPIPPIALKFLPMRLITLASVLATPAFGWEASFSGSVCVLTHATETAEVIVRHDPRATLPYAIQIRRTDTVWQAAPQFLIRFDGPGALTISSNSYTLSADSTTLEVADKGFGNVLAGIALNQMAVAALGEQTLLIPLIGAREHVEAFQDCIVSPKL